MAPNPHRAPALLLASLLFAIAPCASRPTAPTLSAPSPLSAGVEGMADVAGAKDGLEAEPRFASDTAELVAERLERRGRRLTPDERVRVAQQILRSCEHHDLSPALVLAVIEIESAYNPHAVSPVGARGLMQLMPRTGQELAERAGERWRGTDTLFEPETNVRLGVAYLRELIDRYDSVRAALAAYNWGPGRIDGFLRRGTGLPAEYPDLVLGRYTRVSGSPIGS